MKIRCTPSVHAGRESQMQEHHPPEFEISPRSIRYNGVEIAHDITEWKLEYKDGRGPYMVLTFLPGNYTIRRE